MNLTTAIMEDIFQTTLQVHCGAISVTTGKERLVRAHGLNPNSANMSIRSLRHMLNGERYRRALPIQATEYFLLRIKEHSGKDGLGKALLALAAHIDYRHDTNVSVPGLQAVLAKHSK